MAAVTTRARHFLTLVRETGADFTLRGGELALVDADRVNASTVRMLEANPHVRGEIAAALEAEAPPDRLADVPGECACGGEVWWYSPAGDPKCQRHAPVTAYGLAVGGEAEAIELTPPAAAPERCPRCLADLFPAGTPLFDAEGNCRQCARIAERVEAGLIGGPGSSFRVHEQERAAS